ncbi:MAG TPA: ATP-binding protein [Stellaceae bacterium]|nr:ATP-binding protein [Stellaceae bacterium]
MLAATVHTSAALPSSEDRLASVAVPVEPATPDTRCAVVYDRFRADADLIGVPVVDNEKPVGLVNRHELTMRLAHDYGRALYAQKPITALMDAAPLIVESGVQVEALESLIATENPSALMRGFVVTTAGRYAGVASALSLLQLNLARTARRKREAEEARHAAESANRSKSRFLAVMSHELRTPLNAIIGFSDLMQSQSLGPLQPVKYREYAEDIHVSGQNLLGVINDILDMAKIEDGKMVLFEEPIDLGEQISAATRFVAERARQSQVALDRDIAQGLPPLFADQRSVRHILLNLLANAVKFTPGGGRVTVRAERTADRGLALAVADTGIGMSAEHIEIALTPFGQVANEYTRRHDGTGLGLPLVKSLAELHGAAFRIDSTLGIGTTVSIAFPAERVLEPGELRVAV